MRTHESLVPCNYTGSNAHCRCQKFPVGRPDVQLESRKVAAKPLPAVSH